MIKENQMFLVTNRSTGRVVYSIPDLNVRRQFGPGETQRIPYSELLKLTYQPGGKKLLVSFLQVQSEEVLRSFNVNVQPEYFMNEKQVKELLLSGSKDAFLDCLEYAPTGVIDMVKKMAIDLPLTDFEKREILKEKLSYDVDKILQNKKAEQLEEKGDNASPETSTKRERPSASRRTNVTYKE